MAEQFQGERRKTRPPVVVVPDDAELLNVELFDEDGDTADDDQEFDPSIDLDDEDMDEEGDAILFGDEEE